MTEAKGRASWGINGEYITSESESLACMNAIWNIILPLDKTTHASQVMDARKRPGKRKGQCSLQK